MENKTREELRQKLKSKIQAKSNNRKYTMNRKKSEELQQKLLNVKNILQEYSINSVEDINDNNLELNEKINSILSSEDFKYLLSKLSNNPELINILSKIKQNT